MRDEPSPEQIAIYRAMTPTERWRQAQALYWTARGLCVVHERVLRPDWTDEQVEAHVRRNFLRSADARGW